MDHIFPTSLQCEFYHVLLLYICLCQSVRSLFSSINLLICFCITLTLVTDRAGPFLLVFFRNFWLFLNVYSFLGILELVCQLLFPPKFC